MIRLLFKHGILLWLMIYAQLGMAEDPVRLTSDKKTKLDLTGKYGPEIDLLDCQLHVEGKSPNFYLVHSTGVVPIPLHAVKSMQDGASVEIAVEARLIGLPINRMHIGYFEKRDAFEEEIRRPNRFENRIYPQNTYVFLIQEDEKKVVQILKQVFGEARIFIPTKDTGPDNGYAIVLSSKPDLEIVGGYGFYPWFQIRGVTQVEYSCVFE